MTIKQASQNNTDYTKKEFKPQTTRKESKSWRFAQVRCFTLREAPTPYRSFMRSRATEPNLAKVGVVGSNPVARSRLSRENSVGRQTGKLPRYGGGGTTGGGGATTTDVVTITGTGPVDVRTLRHEHVFGRQHSHSQTGTGRTGDGGRKSCGGSVKL